MTEKEKRRFNQMADADKKVRAFVNSAMIGEKIKPSKLLPKRPLIFIYPLQRYDVEMACYGNNVPTGPLMKSAKRTKKKKDPNAPKRSM